MSRVSMIAATLAPLLMAASCSSGSSTTTPVSASSSSAASTAIAFATTDHGSFAEPWASAFLPGTKLLFVTEKAGTIALVDTASGRRGTVSGAPTVDYGGQGGLGDVAFLPGEEAKGTSGRTIYLSWVEAGGNDTRGAVVGRGSLNCASNSACAISGLSVIWRQSPKVTGRGHYSHRIAFSPDGKYLFVTSGERQKMAPAQDLGGTLGKVVRLTLDGKAAPGNPFGWTDESVTPNWPTREIWSYGHRNLLGIDFDAQGRLWEVEHGPAGGDELNLVTKGANYGWPVRSNGDNYDGSNIPDHSADDGFAKPAISWTPVIAPGNMTFYSGNLFAGLKGDLLIAGLSTEAIVRVAIDGESAREVARYPMGKRIRSVIEGPDGALWVLEDGDGGRLLELRPK